MEHTRSTWTRCCTAPRMGTVNLIPVSDLVASVAVINISEQALANPDSTVRPGDIRPWEACDLLAHLPLGYADLLTVSVRSSAQLLLCGISPYAGLRRWPDPLAMVTAQHLSTPIGFWISRTSRAVCEHPAGADH